MTENTTRLTVEAAYGARKVSQVRTHFHTQHSCSVEGYIISVLIHKALACAEILAIFGHEVERGNARAGDTDPTAFAWRAPPVKLRVVRIAVR